MGTMYMEYGKNLQSKTYASGHAPQRNHAKLLVPSSQRINIQFPPITIDFFATGKTCEIFENTPISKADFKI